MDGTSRSKSELDCPAFHTLSAQKSVTSPMREGRPQMEKERKLARLSCSSLPSFHWTLFWKCVLCGALSVLFKCSTSCQVVSYLDPEDLLKLCRLSKRSRALFLSKNCTAVWRDVLARVVDLPKCPRDLTEPQYASLVFDKFCMVSIPSPFSTFN